MSDDVYTRLAAAQDAYDAAIARENELTSDAARARAAAQEAAGVGDKLLADAIAGADVSDADILRAGEAAKHVQAVADLADAKRQHARKRTLQPQVDLLAAKRDVAQHEYNAADEQLVAAAVKVDEILASLHAAIAEYVECGNVAKAAHQRAGQHNVEVKNAIPSNEVLAHQQHMGVTPVTRTLQYYGVSVPRAELFLPPNLSRIDAKRHPIPSLAVLIKGRR
jgi:hypothetical protein